MFTFSKSEDGYVVTKWDERLQTDRPACTVATQHIEIETHHARDGKGDIVRDKEGKAIETQPPTRHERKWPREKWRVRFTGREFEEGELKTLVEELEAVA